MHCDTQETLDEFFIWRLFYYRLFTFCNDMIVFEFYIDLVNLIRQNPVVSLPSAAVLVI